MARFCSCGAIRQRTGCPKCNRDNSGNTGTTTQRGYGWDWQQLRADVLAEKPLCIDCQENGHITPAVELHHIRTIEQAPHLRLTRSNLAPLCSECHDRRHAEPA